MDYYTNYQIENSHKIVKEDAHGFNPRYVGGLDISFQGGSQDSTDQTDIACACLTIFDLETMKIVSVKTNMCIMTMPYVSGYLGFREVPEYKKLIESSDIKPDVLMIDGNGLLHTRKFGSACHLGLEMDIPSIGVGKTLVCIDGLNEKSMKHEFRRKCRNIGDYIEIRGNSGTLYGAAVLTSLGQNPNPIYVSVGHKISLKTAVDLVVWTSIYRIPEPIRIADLESREHLKHIEK